MGPPNAPAVPERGFSQSIRLAGICPAQGVTAPNIAVNATNIPAGGLIKRFSLIPLSHTET